MSVLDLEMVQRHLFPMAVWGAQAPCLPITPVAGAAWSGSLLERELLSLEAGFYLPPAS